MNNEPRQQPLQQTRPPRHNVRRAVFGALIVLVVAAGVILHGQTLVDMVKASRFHPSAQILGADERIGFTDTGTRIFYATAPAIEDKTQFNTDCKSTERTTAILGCYYKDRIYLYNIQNAELDGTLEVTAAHETLHAAYQRLNVFERQRVDAMVQVEYQKIKDQADIKQVMQYYSQAEPGDETNELHSIIGTTVSNLSPELESYYGQYFKDRAAVVSLNAKYNQVFRGLNEQATTLQKQIDDESASLKTDMATYTADLDQLNLDIESFNTRAAGGGFGSQAAFLAARSTLVSRVDTLNARRDMLNARINSYNDKIAELNKLSVKANQLNESLNGVSSPTGV